MAKRIIKRERIKIILLILLLLSSIFIAGCWSKKGIVRDTVFIYGSSGAPYNISIGKNRLSTEPVEWTNKGVELRNNGQQEIVSDVLAKWDTTLVPDGSYTIRLFNDSNSFEDLLYVTTDNVKISGFLPFYQQTIFDTGESIYTLSLPKVEGELCGYCGDGKCMEGYEDCSICPEDCGECSGNVASCGNNICDLEYEGYQETCLTCPSDCDMCPSCIDTQIGIWGKINGTEFENYTIEWSQNSIDWKTEGIYLKNKGLSNKGDEMDRYGNTFENAYVLGTWDISVLTYKGPYFIKLSVNNKGEEGEWKNEEIARTYVIGENLMVQYPSQIKNEGKEDLEGYLQLKILKKNNEQWEDYETLIEDSQPREILREGGMLDLARIFNKLNYSINEPGNYKIYAALLDDSGNTISPSNGDLLESNFEFEVLDKTKPTESLSECSDGTKPDDCSTNNRPKFCGSNLELINKCQSCGCYPGQVCKNNGNCFGQPAIVSSFNYYSIDPYATISNLYKSQLILEKTNYGKIDFIDSIDLSSFKNGTGALKKLEENIKIEQGKISVDSGKMPMLNKNAKLTFYNIDYNPKIIMDGEPCPENVCTEISYDSALKKLTFTTSHFTTYEIQKQSECGNDACEEGETFSNCPSDCDNLDVSDTYVLTEQQFNSGYTHQIEVKDEIEFKINNENHSATLDSVTSNKAKIKIESIPQILELSKGEEKKIELNGDNFYDLFIKLNDIIGQNKVSVTVRSISEAIIIPLKTNTSTECTPNWECSWSSCIDGKKTKECIDKNNCGTQKNKPKEEQVDCITGKRVEAGIDTKTLLIIGGILGFLIIVSVVIILRRKSRR